MPAYNDWPEDFPPVTSLVPYSALRHNSDPEIAALYDRAKNHEDTIAAAELINKLFINEGAETVRQKIESLSVRNPNAIIAYVHAIEGQGKNKIPAALTKFINEISGLEIEDSIVQADIVSKTGVKNTWYRMAHHPSFYGQVQSGREYILVDDVFSAGGTFSELRAYIESNGGKVVNAVTMANGSKSMNPQLGVTKQHILELENKYGVVSVQQFLQEESLYAGNYKALTDSEARTILGAATLDEARNRILAARQEGIVKNSRGMVQSPSLPDEVETSFQEESIQQFLQEVSLYAGNHKALTDSEARTILEDSSLDKARDRILAARQEGNRRIREEVVQRTPLPDEVADSPQDTSLNRNSTNTILSSAHKPGRAGELFSGNGRQTMADEFDPKQQTETDLINEYKDYALEEIYGRGSSISNKAQVMPDIIDDYLEKNSIREDDGSLRVNNLSGLNRQLNAEKPFFGDIMKFAFENDRLPTDAEIAQMPKQGEVRDKPTSLEAANNTKEHSMSDEHNGLNWGSEHIAGAELGIKDSGRFTYFKVKPSGDGQSVILGFNSEANLANERPVIALKAKGDINSAKLLVEEAVKHFTTQKDSGLVDIENYLRGSIEKQQAQKETTSLEAANNTKEHSMSDVQEGTRDLKEEAFLNAVHQRKVIAEALRNGSLACLPGADGMADTAPAVNLVNGTYYHGANMLVLKEFAKANGFPTADYVTAAQMEKAHEENSDIAIRKGQHGISIYVSEQKEGQAERETKHIRLFNVAQATKPWELKTWAEQQQQKEVQEKIEFLEKQYGTSFTAPADKLKTPNPGIVTCSSTEPEKYLGQYLAAVSMGSRFKASPEQAKEFAHKMENALFEKVGVSQKTGNEITNPFSLSKISNAASGYCKQFMSELKQELKKQNQFQNPEQEQKQEHKQSRGR